MNDSIHVLPKSNWHEKRSRLFVHNWYFDTSHVPQPPVRLNIRHTLADLQGHGGEPDSTKDAGHEADLVVSPSSDNNTRRGAGRAAGRSTAGRVAGRGGGNGLAVGESDDLAGSARGGAVRVSAGHVARRTGATTTTIGGGDGTSRVDAARAARGAVSRAAGTRARAARGAIDRAAGSRAGASAGRAGSANRRSVGAGADAASTGNDVGQLARRAGRLNAGEEEQG